MVSAAPPETTQNAELSIQQQLMRELRFNDADLTANRTRKLSEMQDYTLRIRRRRAILIGLSLLLGMAFLASLLIFFGGRSEGSGILTFIGIGVTICAAAIGGTFARHWLRLGADLNAERIHIASGELERVIKPINRRVVNYMIRVGEDEVFVSKEAFELFEHGRTYNLYRAPYTGTLLSIEPTD